MSIAIMNSMMPPAMRLAEHGEKDQDTACDQRGADRHRPALRRVRAGGQAGIDRRTTRRVDDHKQGDKGRDEQVDHGCAGAAT
jgi:hypothetical protein